MFKVEVESVQIANVSGKVKRFGKLHRPAPQLEEGLRLPEARPGNQFRGGELTCPSQKVKPTSPGRRALVKVVHPHLHKGGRSTR